MSNIEWRGIKIYIMCVVGTEGYAIRANPRHGHARILRRTRFFFERTMFTSTPRLCIVYTCFYCDYHHHHYRRIEAAITTNRLLAFGIARTSYVQGMASGSRTVVTRGKVTEDCIVYDMLYILRAC